MKCNSCEYTQKQATVKCTPLSFFCCCCWRHAVDTEKGISERLATNQQAAFVAMHLGIAFEGEVLCWKFFWICVSK